MGFYSPFFKFSNISKNSIKKIIRAHERQTKYYSGIPARDFMIMAPQLLDSESLLKSQNLLSQHSKQSSHRLIPSRCGSQVPTASSSLGPNFTKAQAVLLIEKLTTEERKLFLKELKKVVASKDGEAIKPTYAELKQLAYHNSLPFIGFGFLDNFIMIVAGEYIDITLGAKLGISTMAAAAFGNTVSDMMGIGSAWYVESWADKLGAHPPNLSPEQLEMTSSRICANFGRLIGVALGCLLGMFPLLFIETSTNEEKKE